ncbi:phage tail assembly protein T [Salmonella enterica subsp. enterica]|nr:phage tail assembly protein T [Salmonella enterica subsp. enterica]
MLDEMSSTELSEGLILRENSFSDALPDAEFSTRKRRCSCAGVDGERNRCSGPQFAGHYPERYRSMDGSRDLLEVAVGIPGVSEI